MRSLATLSGALAGLMMIIAGSMIPSGIMLPGLEIPPKFLTLSSTWQVPGLLLCALTCGPKAGIISSVAYLTIGIVHLPVFHDGGSIEYLLNPGFGYLAGFIPASWFCGRLAQQEGMNNLISLTMAALAGLIFIQYCGVLNLIVG